MGKAWVNQHKRHPFTNPQVNTPARFVPGDPVPATPDATDEALALTVPCPRTACAAFCGVACVSYVSGRAIAAHPERVAAARAEAQQ